MKNPFQYTGIASKEFYLHRDEIEASLLEHFESRQNLLVQGPRRMGKTSAILNTFSDLQENNKCLFVHVDFYGVTSVEGVRDKIMFAIDQLPVRTRLRKELEKKLKNTTGATAFGFGLNWSGQQRETLLEDVLSVLAEFGAQKPLAVFFDEFQSLLDAAEAEEILGRLRSEIQKQPDVFYVYAGSDRPRLREIFFLEKSPFFKSAALLEVGSIDRKKFIPWLENRFATGQRTVDPRIWLPLFDLTEDVPGDIQHICHTLWTLSESGDHVDENRWGEAINYLLDMQQKGFIDFWSVISKNQRKLLRGLALYPEQGHSSAAFIKNTGLSSSSASSKALEVMLSRGALWRIGDRLAFSNPFMRLWIMRQEV